MTSPTLVDVAIRDLVKHPKNPRRRAVADPELVDSIRTNGLLQPPVVAPATAGGGKYVLIAGHRRADGAKKAGLKTVQCLLRTDLVTEGQQVEAMLIENGRREDLTPIEEAEGFAQLQLFGYKQKDIAKATGRDPKTVSQRLRLVKLATSTKDRLHKGQMTLDDALAIAEFADDPAVTEQLEKAAKDGYNLKYLIQRHRQVRKDTADAAAEAADLRQRGIREIEPVEDSPYYLGDDIATLRQSGLDDPAQHGDCLVWALAPATSWRGEQVVYGCTDPKSHDDQLEADELERRRAREKEDQERAEEAAARTAARKVRVATLLDTVRVNTRLPVSLRDIVRGLLPAVVGTLTDVALTVYQEAANVPEEDRWKALPYLTGREADREATKLANHVEDIDLCSDGVLTRILVAALLARAEENLTATWRQHRGHASRYLALLEELGHDFCDIDREHRAALDGTEQASA